MFWDLHVAIQNALGWNDSHLHEFRLTTEDGSARCFGLPTDEDHWRDAVHRPLPDWEHRVVGFLQSSGYRIDYNYDFGDNWQHAVIFEDRLPASPGKEYPRCTAGERSGPPDDCGGIHGYESLLEILAEPTHEQYKSSHRWASSFRGIRGQFDSEAFEEQRVKFEDPARRLRMMLDDIE